MINNIDMLRFLTFVPNDILAYCDTVSDGRRPNSSSLPWREGLKGGGNQEHFPETRRDRNVSPEAHGTSHSRAPLVIPAQAGIQC